MTKSAELMLVNIEVMRLVESEPIDEVDTIDFCSCGRNPVKFEGVCEACIERIEEGDELQHPDQKAHEGKPIGGYYG